MLRFLRTALIIMTLAAIGTYAAFRLSPWPTVLLIRTLFDSDAARAMAALQPRVPAGLVEHLDIPYDSANPDLKLDLILPPGTAPAQGWPVVVWVHGGAWVSGSKENIGNYLRVMAGHGFAMVGVSYTLAPAAKHPEPARQVSTALTWLQAHAEARGVDPTRVALAGDSAGAQIAAQVAIATVDPAYAAKLAITPGMPAAHLKGAVLFCGGYDLASINMDGAFGGFLRSIVWAYLGDKDIAKIPDAALFSIPPNLTPAMPPLFISAGNGDPLLPQSQLVAQTATDMGIPVQTLFFPTDTTPPLGHEHQFNLDRAEGQQALTAAITFLKSVL